MTAKPKMSRDEVIEGLSKLEMVFDSFFWKGQKEHPEKTELLDIIKSAIALLQSQPDTKGQRVGEDIEEILKFHLTSEHGWHFDAPYPGYSFDPVKIIAHALASRLVVPKIDREKLIHTINMFVKKISMRKGYFDLSLQTELADAIIAELESK